VSRDPDSSPQAVIVSDLHIGSRYFLADEFTRFINALPAAPDLFLIGDVVSRRGQTPGQTERALNALRELSERQRVIWIRGNHDPDYHPPDPGQIRFVPSFEIHGDQRVLVVHGHGFDRVMPRTWLFQRCFEAFHCLRVRFGADAMHVAEYAKNWGRLYGYLRRSVVRRAIAAAEEGDYQVVICGHVHLAEDTIYTSLRYLNTGAWTESPNYCAIVDNHGARLERADILARSFAND